MRIIPKPWGEELILYEKDKWMVKIIRVKPNARTSLQYHKAKLEWLFNVKESNVTYIGPNEIHRHKGEVELIEVSHGNDNDIKRLSDDYGREDKRSNRNRRE